VVRFHGEINISKEKFKKENVVSKRERSFPIRGKIN